MRGWLLTAALGGSGTGDGSGGIDDPQPGIAAELAQQRARDLRDVRYGLRFRLTEGTREVEGWETLRFQLDQPIDLVVDFEGALLADVRVNGVELEPRIVHDHFLVPATTLRAGENQLEARFRSAVAPTGTPLTVYHDAADGKDYYYTLVVPADAHRLFPCFDQPDLKGRFQLELEIPAGWSAVGNGEFAAQESVPGDPGLRRWRFQDSAPISTYLFAFACGPFAVEETRAAPPGVDGVERPLRVFLRPSKRATTDFATLFAMHERSLAWLEEYFDHPYPFGKLDFVLAPGFPYGGMEHPGAIFYRESALSFDREPTLSELHRRSTLIYHEVSHQWFGNLVTMRWFDDLWLKEGFATFAGYRALEALEPERNAWLRFQQQVKPSAYRVDVTPGTTPVYQRLGNLADAKSNYGAIVYNKAPAVLRELESRLGEVAFREGVRRFLRRHAFANATWSQLIEAMSDASGANLSAWSQRWIQTAGMPRVRCEWTVDEAGRLESIVVRQEDRTGEGRTWPLQLEVLLCDADGAHTTYPLTLVGERAELRALAGRPAPRWVLLDPRDVEYGQFLLDEQSVEALLHDLPFVADPLVKAVAFAALYESVREAELDPDRFLDRALKLLREEDDPLSHAPVLAAVSTTVRRYLEGLRAVRRRAELVNVLLEQLAAGELRGQESALWRSLTGFAQETRVQETIRAVLDGELRFPGLALGPRDRFASVGALIGAGCDDGLARLEALQHSESGDFAREVYVARAAHGTAANKKEYFESWQNPDEPPEQWIQSSLGAFHAPGQEALTLPYLRPALDQVLWVKEHRRIFFMPAWINAFVNGHDSPEALAIVEAFLEERADLSPDVILKIQQSLDGLRRSVAVRERWRQTEG